MNIFYLDHDVKKCAEMTCDKHVVKMVIEYAQLLSTAHRMQDGVEYTDLSKNGRKIKRWRLTDERENILYKAGHINHPSAVWVRLSKQHYTWLHNLLTACLTEYTNRYGKIHLIRSSGLEKALENAPNSAIDKLFSPPPPAMPEEHKVQNDVIQSYKNYYIHEKNYFAKWKNGNAPEWYTEGVKQLNTVNAYI